VLEIGAGLGIVRMEPDDFLPGGNGSVEVSFLAKRMSQIRVGVGIGRIAGFQVDGFGIGGNRPVEITLSSQRIPQIIMSLCIVRLKYDGRAELGDGFHEIAPV